MSVLLLDTNVVSYIMRGHSLAEQYRGFLAGQTLAVSFMTIAEMYEGAYRDHWGARRIAILEKVFEDYVVVPSSAEICRYWGEIRASRRRRPISPEDAWIAATALAHSCPLVTHDASDFDDITGLKVITAS